MSSQWQDFLQIVEENEEVAGDVSADGVVDVDDLNIIINTMLGKN